MRICVHDIVSALANVLHEAQVERAAAVLIALKLCNGSLGSLGRIEANDTGTTGATAGLVLDLGLLNLANGGEQFNQIVVAGGPGQLFIGLVESRD